MSSRNNLWIFLLVLTLVNSNDANPNVYWSMDELPNDVLKPDLPIDDRGTYSANLSDTKSIGISGGVYGNGLQLYGTSVKFTEARQESNCFLEPWSCGADGGFSLAGWFLIHSTGTFDCLVTTTPFCYYKQPGMLLRSYGDKLEASVCLKNGELYRASTVKLEIGQWAHIGMTWSPTNGVKIYINGSVPNYTDHPSLTTIRPSSALSTFQLGAKSTNYNMVADDLKIWFREISQKEMMAAIPAGYTSTTTTATTLAPSTTTLEPTTSTSKPTTTTSKPTTTTLKPTTTTLKPTTTKKTTTTTTTTTGSTTIKPTTSSTTTTSAKPSTTSSTLRPSSEPPIKTTTPRATIKSETSGNPTTAVTEITTAVPANNRNSDTWKWIIVAVVIILVLFAALVIFLLCRRGNNKRGEFQPVAWRDVRTTTTAVTSSVAMSEDV